MTLSVEQFTKPFETLTREEVTDDWFRRWSDAIDAINDPYMEAMWRYDSDRSDEARQARFRLFQREVEPEVNRLEQLLTAKAVTYKPQDETIQRIVAKKKVAIQAQAEANVALEAEAAALTSEFATLVSKQTVHFEGQTFTSAQVAARLQDEPDRATQEHLWRALETRKAQDTAHIDRLMLELVKLRKQMAANVGLSYAELCWREKQRTDFTPEDSLRLVNDVTDVFADVYKARTAQKAAAFGLSEVRPWDAPYLGLLQHRVRHRLDRNTALSGAVRARPRSRVGQAGDCPTLRRYGGPSRNVPRARAAVPVRAA